MKAIRFNKRTLALAVIDAMLINLAVIAALWLRFDGQVPAQYVQSYQSLTILFTGVSLASFYIFGLYRRLWEYASLGELTSIVYAVTAAVVLNICVTYFWMHEGSYTLPRSVFILYWMALIFLIGGSRLSWRLFRDSHLTNGKIRAGKPVLVVGAGDAGATVARELHNYDVRQSFPVGYVDDDPAKQNKEMFGIKVLGTTEDIPQLVDKYCISEIIIAMPSAPKKAIRRIVEICQQTPAKLKILPGIYELIDGSVSINQIREVMVEDILGREPVEVDIDSISGYLTGKTVLITGAGGSIGSELCRQVAHFNPRTLVLLGHGENSIYHIHSELVDSYPDLDIKPVICDVKDRSALYRVFRAYSPRVVFHAAAHKHVPLMEFNPAEAIKNNVLGTYNTASMASRFNAERFILISTDKAINPTSIMGATKRVAEMVIQHVALDSSTLFAAVRFGNVLGSRGSVVPRFKEQIARGGPVTVTHPDMIRLSGFIPGEDIEITYTGIRPGEKLYEEMLTDNEQVNVTRHDRIYIAKVDRPDESKLISMLNIIMEPGWSASGPGAVRLLKDIVPEFRKDIAQECEPEVAKSRRAGGLAVVR